MSLVTDTLQFSLHVCYHQTDSNPTQAFFTVLYYVMLYFHVLHIVLCFPFKDQASFFFFLHCLELTYSTGISREKSIGVCSTDRVQPGVWNDMGCWDVSLSVCCRWVDSFPVLLQHSHGDPPQGRYHSNHLQASHQC